MDAETTFHSRKRTLSAAFGPSDGNKNDTISAYDVESEPSPSELFYSSAYQSAMGKWRGIGKRTADAVEIAQLSLMDTENLPRLIDEAKALSKFEASDTRTIAVLGGSGEGKSSLINSLLHFPDIANSGDIGAACTSVVTEYRLKRASDYSPITMEVEYLSAGEKEELVKELLWSFRRMYLPNAEDDGVSETEYAKMQRESAESWCSLEAGFSHQKDFSEYLLTQDMSENGLAKATAQLVQWTRELNWPAGADTGKWTSTADTADECYEKTSVFMEDRFWPFTKIIRIYIDAKVLRAGIILADLPGLHDTNLARVKATRDYLRRCNLIFVVAKISRAITDQSLKSSLLSVMSKNADLEWEDSEGRGMKIAVVCTNSENINEKSARREFCGHKKRIPQEVMANLDQDIAKEEANGNRSLAEQLKWRRRFLLINARNMHVKEGLQKAYSAKIPKGVLEVFCVSNTSYEKYSMEGDIEMVQASGIPELRRFCKTLTSHALLLQANHYMRSKTPSLLNSILLWAINPTCPTTEAKIDGSVYSALFDVKNKVSGAVSQSKVDFMDLFRNLVLTRLDQESGAWENIAREEGSSWCHWHWSQYKAWCQNDGDHMTRARRVNWNAELTAKMRTDMGFRWEALKEQIPKLFTDLLQSINASWLRLQSQIRGELNGPALTEAIDVRIRGIEYPLSQAAESLTRGVGITCSKASEPNESSYVATEMIPAYRSAAQEYGAGTAARQRKTVQGRIEEGTLFSNMSTAIIEDIKAEASAIFNSVQEELDKVFNEAENDITVGLAVNKDSCDMRDITREDKERRKEGLAEEIQKLKRQHEEVLAAINAIMHGAPQVKEDDESYAL